jgi:hypothetical protein
MHITNLMLTALTASFALSLSTTSETKANNTSTLTKRRLLDPPAKADPDGYGLSQFLRTAYT